MNHETVEIFWPSFLLGAQAGIILTMAGVYLAHLSQAYRKKQLKQEG